MLFLETPFIHVYIFYKLMESGVPGASGVAVLRPVDQVVGLGLGDVILQLHLMVDRHAVVTAVNLETAVNLLVNVGIDFL